MLSNDDDSNQSEPDWMSLEKCPHCDKTFEDQHIWNKYNRAKHMSSHTRYMFVNAVYVQKKSN